LDIPNLFDMHTEDVVSSSGKPNANPMVPVTTQGVGVPFSGVVTAGEVKSLFPSSFEKTMDNETGTFCNIIRNRSKENRLAMHCFATPYIVLSPAFSI